MNKELKILYSDDTVTIKELSYKKIHVSYDVNILIFVENNWMKIDTRKISLTYRDLLLDQSKRIRPDAVSKEYVDAQAGGYKPYIISEKSDRRFRNKMSGNFSVKMSDLGYSGKSHQIFEIVDGNKIRLESIYYDVIIKSERFKRDYLLKELLQ